jgi:hypothetical protein
MAIHALNITSPEIIEVNIHTQTARLDHGLLVTFRGNLSVYFDATWLYDQREVCGNFVVEDDNDQESLF